MSELSTPLLMWKLHSPIGFRFVPRFSSRKKALLRANSEDLKKDLTLYLICAVSDTAGGLLWLLSPLGHSTLDISLN